MTAYTTPQLRTLPPGSAREDRTYWLMQLQGNYISVLQQQKLLPDRYRFENVQSLLEACATSTGASVVPRDVHDTINRCLPDYALQALSAHLVAAAQVAA